jgi:hypothetical protein
MKFLLRNKMGQTSVEYILMIVVIVTVMGPLMKKVQDWMIDNPDSQLNGFLKFAELDPAFKYFTLRK